MEPTQTPETPLTREQKVDYITSHSPMIRASGNVDRHKMILDMKSDVELDDIYLNLLGDVLMGNVARADEDHFEPRLNQDFDNA